MAWHRVLRRLYVLLLCAEHLADGVQRVDLCADVAVLRRHIGDGRVEIGQRRCAAPAWSESVWLSDWPAASE